MSVCQCELSAMCVGAMVMSGEVGCWFDAGGLRVDVLVLSVRYVVFSMVSEIIVTRWSLSGENQVSECAFASAVIIVLLSCVR